MAQYTPKSAPKIAGLDVATVWRELQEIRATLETMQVDYVEYKVHNREPDKPRPGRMYYADGINWNPGNGEGLYIYFNQWELVAGKGNTRPKAAFLRLVSFAPFVHKGNKVTPVVPGFMSLTGYAPTVRRKTKLIPAGNITLLGFAPSVLITEYVRETIVPGSLNLTGNAPTITITP